jgi:hypothetical protein
MPLALPLRLLAQLYALRLSMSRPPEPRKNRRIDLCLLPPYLRRDIGLESFRCETREDWRTFR